MKRQRDDQYSTLLPLSSFTLPCAVRHLSDPPIHGGVLVRSVFVLKGKNGAEIRTRVGGFVAVKAATRHLVETKQAGP